MTHKDPIVIVGMARTALGAFQGGLASQSAPQLGSVAMAAALDKAAIDPKAPDMALMGCVLSAGLGQAPARQAALGAGMAESAGAVTLNKMCGSGMQAVIMAHDALLARSSDLIVAGGMESMSNAPYLLPQARGGYRFGHGQVLDHMMLDGLEDAYEKGCSMGVFADRTAARLGFSRQDQDDFAKLSATRAQQALAQGDFANEIAPVTIATRLSSVVVDQDEGPARVKLEKISSLKPAFTPDGTVTAASSSSLSDGAAAVVLMRKSDALAQGKKIIAEIRAHAFHAQTPAEFTLSPISATRKVLEKAQWSIDQVDLFEINEAFAVVTMAAIKELGLDIDRVNVKGGACALGHPIGATGARIIVTLLSALEQRGLQRGVASLCIGGGEATAIALERTV